MGILRFISQTIHVFLVLNSFYDLVQISSLANAIRVLATMEEPIGQVLKRTEVCGISTISVDRFLIF